MSINTTLSTAGSTYINKEYYDKKLLETAKTRLVYGLFGQKRSIPKNGGKSVEFRRWNLFTPDTVSLALTEGQTPASQALSQSKVEATVKQYGSFIETSDLLEMTAFDPIQADASELLGDQIGRTIDWVTRDAMIADASAHYCGGNTKMLQIEATNKLTVAEVRKAAKTLEKAKAPRFTDGGSGEPYICIVDPDAAYDLMGDADWKTPAQYVDTQKVYKGELGEMYGVKFVKSTEGYVSKQSVLNKVNANVTSGHDFVLKTTPTAAEVAYLSTPGNKIKVGALELTLDATTPYTAATKTVKVTETLSGGNALTADDIVYSEDAGKPDNSTKAAIDVHHSLIFGKDAYGIIDIAGSGSMRIITKPQGSSGTDDPLDQRATIAAKVDAYAAKVLNSLWIIDMMHAVS